MVVQAIAKWCNVPLLDLPPSKLKLGNNVQRSELFVESVFSLANKISPLVILIDHIDTKFTRLSAAKSGSAEVLCMVGHFWSKWRGASKLDGGVTVIGTTDDRKRVDKEVLGRLPLKVEFSLPDREERIEILHFHSQRHRADTPLDVIRTAAGCTQGRSHSALVSIVDTAVYLSCRRAPQAAQNAIPTLTMDDFEQAILVIRP